MLLCVLGATGVTITIKTQAERHAYHLKEEETGFR